MVDIKYTCPHCRKSFEKRYALDFKGNHGTTHGYCPKCQGKIKYWVENKKAKIVKG